MNTIADTSSDTLAPAPAARPAAPVVYGANLALIIAILSALLLLIFFALGNARTPQPLSVSADPALFSAGRAMAQLHHIAAEPHPTGTRENAAVRAYLVAELKALGLAPQVQTGLGTLVAPYAAVGGYVHNVVARLPGREPGPALMLVAHYDSVPTGPGAADDGASVAAILETVRALRAGAPLRNDVIVLFTDGEEAGLLGAQAFASRHPWARDVGLLLNFEYRGNSGPMLMFETTPNNGKMIEAFAAARHPVGNSLMYEVYRMLPNDTDMSAFKRAGLAGMNFAAMEKSTGYHTGLDSVALLDQGSLQHQGELMLELARRFGNGDLRRLDGPNRIYFDLPGYGLVHYPAGLALPLAGAVALLCAVVLAYAVRRGALRAGRVLAAAVLLPLTATLFALVATMLWAALGAVHPQYRTVIEPYNAELYMGALVCLGVALCAGLGYRLQRWFVTLELGMGVALCWTGLMLASAALMPGASFLFTWPLLGMLPALAWLVSARAAHMRTDIRLLLLLACSAPAVILFAPVIRTLFIALTLQMAGVAVFVLALVLGLLYPLAAGLKRRFVFPMLPLAAGVVLLVTGSVTAGVSPRQPQANTLFYVEHGKTGQALWVSNDPQLDAWQQAVFGPRPALRKVPEMFGDRPRQYWVAPAPALGIPAPSIEVTEDRESAGVRHIGLRVRSLRAAPQLKLYGEGVEVLKASMDGVPVSDQPQPEWAAAAIGLPPEGAEFRLQVKPGRPFVLRVIDRTYGLPPGVAPRTPDMMAQPLGTSDSIQAVSSAAFQ